MKKHNYVYTIVRQTPNEQGVRKGYIGVHCTDDLDDGYFGSGRYLKRAVNKYGREDFVKTIVADFETEEEAVAYETELLHRMHRLSGGWELFSERFYNLRMNDNRGKVSMSESTRKKIGEANSGVKNPMFGKTGEKHNRFGKAHSEESRKKIGESKSGEKSKNFKGFTIGNSLENGKNIIFNGNNSMKSRGFDHGTISKAISGKLQHYKKFTFTRTKDPEILQSLLDKNNFIDEESKTIIENFLK